VAAATCAEDPLYHTLDRWLGEWRIVALPDSAPREIGRTVMRTVVDGCAIEEVRRLADGSEQRTLGVFDSASRSWRHSWVNSDGDSGFFETMPADDAVRVTGTIHLRGTGQEVALRSAITPRRDGGFDERLEISTDGGRTFELQPATAYLPLIERASAEATGAPVVPPAPTPTAEELPTAEPLASAPPPAAAAPPAQTPAVRLFSRPKAEAKIRDTAMESPMTVEFELGPLAALPAGSSWRTTELAPYVVDNVSIPMVTAGRDERRGKVTVELIVNLLTRSRGAKVDLETTLLADGAAVASAKGENIALGKLIGSHDPEVGRPYRLSFELDSATFAELFAADRRPTIRLTLSVR
jgi:hypothetical protein